VQVLELAVDKGASFELASRALRRYVACQGKYRSIALSVW
jgi:hypothetical protein